MIPKWPKPTGPPTLSAVSVRERVLVQPLTVSSVEAKGRSQHMLRVGAKRRRTKVEMQEHREEERLRQEGRDRQSQQLRELS